MNNRSNFINKDAYMLLDEMMNAFCDPKYEVAQDQEKLKQAGVLFARYFNQRVNTFSDDMSEWFPNLDDLLVKKQDKLDQKKYADLLNELKPIIESLGNEVLRADALEILDLANQELEFSQHPEKFNTQAPTLFGARSEKHWLHEMMLRTQMTESDIIGLQKKNETFRDLYFRLMSPENCYLVIMKTDGSDPLSLVREGGNDFFKQGVLFADENSASEYETNQQMQGRPLLIHITLSLKDAKASIADGSIKEYIRRVNDLDFSLEQSRIAPTSTV